jgi:hypothetical protein
LGKYLRTYHQLPILAALAFKETTRGIKSAHLPEAVAIIGPSGQTISHFYWEVNMKTKKTYGFFSLATVLYLAITLVFALYSESVAVDATESKHVFISPFSNAFGFSVFHAGDFNGDDLDDLIVGAPETPPQESQAYIFYGRDESDPTLERMIFLRNANVVLTGPSSVHSDGSLFGHSVSGGKDFNDDGYDDVIVGAPYAGLSGETYEGCVYVFFGQEHSRDSDRLTISYSFADLTICGENSDDMFGFSVAMVGKLNDDEMDDIVIGAPGYINNFGVHGYIYVINGFDTHDTRPVLPVKDIAVLGGSQGYGMAGYSVAGIADFNNDGYDEYAIGKPLRGFWDWEEGGYDQYGSAEVNAKSHPENLYHHRISEIVGGQTNCGIDFRSLQRVT